MSTWNIYKLGNELTLVTEQKVVLQANFKTVYAGTFHNPHFKPGKIVQL